MKNAILVWVLAAAAAFGAASDVNPLSGGLEAAREDLVLGAGNARFTLRRTHRPELGRPWHWSCDTRLVLESEDGLLWIDEEGAVQRFEARGGEWVSAQGAPRALRRDGQGYRLEVEGRTYRFDGAGRLLERSTCGTRLRFTPGVFGTEAVQGPWGELRLERSPFGIERAALADLEVRYAYRDGGLVRVERGALRETYSYDDLGRLNRLDETRVHYDGEGRVTHLVGGRIPLQASYGREGQALTCELREGARGVRYTYDPAQRTLSVAPETGETLTYSFDDRQRPRTLERGGKLERSWRYDRQGRLSLLHGRAGDLRLRYGGGAQPTQVELPTGEELRFVYDEDGRLTAARSARGDERFAYDAAGLLIKHQAADGTLTQLKRDAQGYVVAAKTPEGVRSYERSAGGELRAVVHPDGRRVDFAERGAALKVVDAHGTVEAAAFDPRGRLIAYQDEFGRATRVDYNAFGLIARAYDKEGDLFRCDYDAQGQLVGVTDAAGNQVRYTRPDAQTLIVEDPSAGRRELSFDAEGQVVRERRGEAVLRFRYDDAGRLVARTTPAGEERFTYDSAGRLIAQAGPDGELRYTYDALGRLLSLENRVLFERIGYRYEGSRRQPSEVIYPWGSVRYAYDAAGRLSEVGLGEDRIQIARTADGRRERIRYPNGVETRFRYAGSLLEETASRRGRELLSRRAYAYDDRGRIATVTDEAGRVTRFSHDRRGRLLEAAGDQHLRYAYDAAGNRTSVEVDGARRALEVGEGNRVLALGEARYTYGAHGALASREDAQGTTRYTVDVDGRLRGVEGPDGRVVRFGYAPDGTPLWREVDGARTRYLVDRDQVVGEFDGGGLRRRYVRGEGLDDLLASEGPDGERLTFHRDLVGSVVALSDAAGEVAARYAYGPFGEALHAEGPAAAGNRWRFAGRPLDPETGLYDVRARHYDPALGRFTSPDPSGREGGLNLYAYAENDPTRLTDPLGLSAELGARLEERTAAPKQSLFGRMLAAVDRAGQSLPGPFRTQYNLLKGVSQAGVDTVVGIGELFKKETWVALGEFVSELDDWETVKAVGKHLADAGIDLGKRYVDAALNDPDEFARMTGYGAGMVIAGVLGTKGIDKLAKVARAAKAARAARRAAEVVDDVADARRATKPVVAVAGGERATTAGASSTAGSTATQTTGTATQTTAGSTAAGTATQESLGSATASRGGIAQALDDSVPLGSGRAAAKRLNERLTKLYDDYFDQDLPDEELVANVKQAIAESDLPDAFKAELADLDDYYALSSVVRDGGEELFALANSSDPALRAYAADLVKARRNYTLGEDKQFRHALKDAERVHGLPAVEATEITNGSGGLGRIFSGQYKGKDAVFKFDRSVDYDTVGEIEEVAKGLEAYGGPEVLGRVRVQDSNGVWREAVAMEKVEGYDLSALLRAKKAGEPLPLEVTPAHTRAIEELTQRLTREGRVLEETNLGDFMLTNDPDRPVVLLDMFVKEGTHRPHGGLLDHNGRPVVETVESLLGR